MRLRLSILPLLLIFTWGGICAQSLAPAESGPYQDPASAPAPQESPNSGSQSVKDLQALFQSGSDLIQQARYQEAPSLWGSALYLGVSYYRTDRFTDAVRAFQKALALKPDLPDAQFWLGCGLVALNQPEPAIPYLTSYGSRKTLNGVRRRTT